jgi:serine-type D-Ala-D-Ala carboxypeptidase (penicillin-binding protein 5/6)
VLEGGGRRRRDVRRNARDRRRKRAHRRQRALTAVAILLAPVAVAAAAYLALTPRDSPARGKSRPSFPLAANAHPTQKTPRLSREPSPLVQEQPTPEVPLNGVDAFHIRMRKPPRAALLFDVATGEVLWRLRPLTPLPMASLTKIMTAVVVTTRAKPRERVAITRAALKYQGSGVGILPKGKRVRLETLLNGMLLVSGNDASIALADHVAGSESRFVGLMNREARRLGLRCTRFADSHGLSAGDRSCARDLAVLTRLAMANRRIARIVRRRQASFRFPVKGGRIFLSGHNPLIRAGYRGAIGLKTGYTDEAGPCFVGVARRAGRTLGVVLLNSRNPLKHAAALLDEGFRQG